MTHRLPTLVTDRLTLRPFELCDAPCVQTLAGHPEVYRTTTNLPHPYLDGMAESWIASHGANFNAGLGITLAVSRTDDGAVVGCVGLIVTPPHHRAELGYWIGVPFWHNGFATEAAKALVDYGFNALGIHKIAARHFAINPQSGRIMQKLGMTREALLRDEICKDGVFHDIVVYGAINPSGGIAAKLK